MFKSIELKKYLPETKEYLFKLIDDDFEIEVFATDTAAATTTSAAVIKAYLSKSYSLEQIGENFALFTIWYVNKHKWKIEELISYQDKYLIIDYPEYKDIYPELKKYRDKYIQLFTIFQ